MFAQNDFSIIRKNIVNNLQGGLTDASILKQVKKITPLQSTDGGWKDIDYKDSSITLWKPATSYEHAMLIDTDSAEMKQFVSEMSSLTPAFKVIQRDSLAHIVYYTTQHLTGYILFTQEKPTNDSLNFSNNKPCLLMYQKQQNKISLSVTDPDLGFYEGPDDTPLLPDGKRKEVSIYSKKWYPSQQNRL